jgi:predicted nucleic acid-binding protein
MNSVFLDANILLYAKNKNSAFHERATDVLESLSEENIIGYVTPYVLNEVHYVILKVHNQKLAQVHLAEILDLPNLKLVDFTFSIKDITAICSLATKYHLKTFDAFHAYYCKKLKIKSIATFDQDFKSIPWLNIYSPTQE